jgi:putative hemolysin
MEELSIAGEENEFNTVAGLVLHFASHIPETGFSFNWHGYKVEVIDMDGHKIDKLLIKKI